MELTEEERKALFALQKEKAERNMRDADFAFDNGRLDMAMGRYYYAVFFLVQALFLLRGIKSHTHSGQINKFSEHFVKTGLVSVENGRFYNHLEQMREKADYDCTYNVTETDATEIRRKAKTLYATLLGLLKVV